MRCFLLVGLALGSPAPQYSGSKSQLTSFELDTIADIFGSSGTYAGKQTSQLNGNKNNGGAEVLVQVVTNEAGYVAPDDYQPSPGALTNQASTTVDNVFENCADYTASQGYECVPYYQCHNGSIITDGGGLIDIRNGFGILSPAESKCPGFLDVCCKDPDFVPPPPPVVKYSPKCGQRHRNGLGVRIQSFSDNESQFGEWPHMCAVLAEEQVQVQVAGESNKVNLYQCGGSLIAPGIVLTAAHCVAKLRQQPRTLKVRCGEWDTQRLSEPRAHQDRRVRNVDIHPEFNERNLANDWALLYTEQDFELEEHIDTICLPHPDDVFDFHTCHATGWGKDQFGAAGQYQVVLKEVSLPIVGHNQCQETLRNTRLGSRFKLDHSFLCAGGAGQDTCKGDGGSPLVCSNPRQPGSYVQAGLVAWGVGCGEKNVPGVYANVARGVCWIDWAATCQAGRFTGDFTSRFGFSSRCQEWMDIELTRLRGEVAAMQNVGSLTGQARARVVDAGLKAQDTLAKYSSCSVVWSHHGSQQLNQGGNGYYGGESQVDTVATFGRRTKEQKSDSSAVRLTASTTY